MKNITTILNSFESGSYYTEVKYSKIFHGNVQGQLNDILTWVNYNLAPTLFNEIRYDLDSDSILECIDLAVSLRKKFADFISLLKNKQYLDHISKQELTSFCNICKYPECSLKTGGYWNRMQQHQYIEMALSNYNTNNHIPTANLPAPINSNEMQQTSELAQNVSNFEEAASDLNTVHHSSCSQCDCKSNVDFKFKFLVDYDPKVKMLLYGDKQLETIDGNGVKLSTIQFRGNTIFACLLCNRDAGYEKSYRTIVEHINGQRHKKNKTKKVQKALLIYHNNWMKIPFPQQAHQSYFYPVDAVVNMCCLCCIYVPYENLEFHILSESHMSSVMRLYKKETRSVLLQIQTAVYLPELAESMNIDDTKKVMEVRSKERITANLDREETDSDSSEEDKIEQSVEVKQNDGGHQVTVSISNRLGKSLTHILESRFHPHLKFLQVILHNKGFLNCSCCQLVLPNCIENIKEHVYSKPHLLKCGFKPINWRFHCDICNFYFSKEVSWQKHYKDTKHIECCNRLGARSEKLCEYQCATCNNVIYGDEMSVKRHKRQRHRKKEIILSPEVKEAFKNQKHIEEQCEKLVASANKVLSNPQSMIMCCNAIENALSETFKDCRVYPFGSRISGLGSEKSDLDVFVDLGDMYLGTKKSRCSNSRRVCKNC